MNTTTSSRSGPQTFALYRFLNGTEILASNPSAQLGRLRYILKHEPPLENCHKYWILYQFPNPWLEDVFAELIRRWKGVGLRIPPEEAFIQGPKTHPSGPRPDSNADFARNLAIQNGQAVADWILPWDADCVFTKASWGALTAILADSPRRAYFSLVDDAHGRALNNAEIGCSLASGAMPQFIFHRTAELRFEEACRDGFATRQPIPLPCAATTNADAGVPKHEVPADVSRASAPDSPGQSEGRFISLNPIPRPSACANFGYRLNLALKRKLPKSQLWEACPIYFERMDQMGSRLESFLNVWRVARQLHRRVILYWPPHSYSDGIGKITDLFDTVAMSTDPATSDVEFNDGAMPSDLRENIQNLTELSTLKGWPAQLKRNHRKLWRKEETLSVCRAWSYNLRFTDEKRSFARAELGALLRLLQPHPKIVEALKQAREWLGQEEYTAIHIRRGDVIHQIRKRLVQLVLMADPQQPTTPIERKLVDSLRTWLRHFTKRVATLDAYAAAAEATASRNLVLFTDTAEVGPAFADKVDKLTLIRDLATPELGSDQRTLLELYLISGAGKIIATNSAFSNLGSLLGAKRLHDARKYNRNADVAHLLNLLFDPILEGHPKAQACFRSMAQHALTAAYPIP